MHEEVITGCSSDQAQGYVFVGTGSRWHNPFEFEEGEEGYLAFKEWFYSSAYSAVRLRKGVLDKLANMSLICDCKDVMYCHAKVIAEYLESQS